ncbi:MAG: DEAD/DEAH box helicase [Brevundimonas sp.]|uniref:helicase-related protein n=1 Tax=Brevundimonas sp. TaxID=1871086 RepID=UPI00120F1F81|nr:helicase-related protein [Brevundimonas sp.]RZJ16243.1 MAG: DEAD/DEAH box helicase [Brevundimonas sp.]
MLAHNTGMIGLPLRLLAREIYDRMVKEKGEKSCALITGEERIKPPGARWYACTVEAMPVSEGADFMAIDEIQLAQDPDRGHVFTDRILHARGRHETMLLGADTMRPALQRLDLDIDGERRERFSQLSYAGPTKITKLPKRSAIVAFSSEEVYAIAELLKRQRGGCAVIMGALSPRTRNAQVELYQSGEVDYIVATDAIGMGLNLDVGHIAFASRRKFDGRQRRYLRADELAQIAGRAGRFRDDGTFGETADCTPFEEETVERIVNHHFEPVDYLNWRNSDLDWSSVANLLASLRRPSPDVILRRAPEALDEMTLATLAQDEDVVRHARTYAHVRRLWDLCTLPDFRKHGPDAHFKLVQSFVEKLADPSARIKDEWMFAHVEPLDRTEGEIDTLQQRLAAIRTWTYAANRTDWLENAQTWRGRTREIEDKLSDALHQALMLRFVDRRTSALLKTLNSQEDEPAQIGPAGEVIIGGHTVGHLHGLVFTADSEGDSLAGRALRGAALKALRPVMEQRLAIISQAPDADIAFDTTSATIVHDGAPVARLVAATNWHSPSVHLLGAGDAAASSRDAAHERLARWFVDHVKATLPALDDLRNTLDGTIIRGAARGTAFQLLETGAAFDRRATTNARQQPPLSPEDRAALNAAGVKAGRVAAWLPGLLKPAAARLALALRAVHSGQPPREPPTQSSFALAKHPWSEPMLWTAGYLRVGPRAVRADLAERLMGSLAQIRRASESSAFAVPPELAAQVGCPAADFPAILRGLGLKPAEKDRETGAVKLWRFPAQRAPDAAPSPREGSPRAKQNGRKPQPPAPPPTGPFAVLAQLITTEVPRAHRRRRRHKRPAQSASPTPKVAS